GRLDLALVDDAELGVFFVVEHLDHALGPFPVELVGGAAHVGVALATAPAALGHAVVARQARLVGIEADAVAFVAAGAGRAIDDGAIAAGLREIAGAVAVHRAVGGLLAAVAQLGRAARVGERAYESDEYRQLLPHGRAQHRQSEHPVPARPWPSLVAV